MNNNISQKLISDLKFMSDEKLLESTWFNERASNPEEDFNYFFDSPHIVWDEIFPGISNNVCFIEVRDLLDKISGEEFKKYKGDNYVDLEILKKSDIWRKLPPVASELIRILENFKN